MTAARNAAVDRTIEQMQTPVAKGGNMPVDSGYLRSSLQVTTGAPIPAAQPNPGGSYTYEGQQVVTVLVGAPLDAVIYATYGAAYAPYVEYGARGRRLPRATDGGCVFPSPGDPAAHLDPRAITRAANRMFAPDPLLPFSSRWRLLDGGDAPPARSARS
jgi:hypothetical protein